MQHRTEMQDSQIS